MNNSLVHTLESGWIRQSSFSINAHRLFKSTRLIGVGVVVGGLLLMAAIFVLTRFATVSGKVISSDTNMPIEGAMVYIHSGMPYEEDGFNTYAKTDANGKFKASARGEVSVIRVWKPGYALRGINPGYAPTLLRREIGIQLRELTPTNLVTEHHGFYHFKPGDGFSFKQDERVSGDSPDADIVIVQDANNRSTAFIAAAGEGGIVFQPWDNKIDFDNSPEAPYTGYEKRLSLIQPQDGFYFLRTRDGEHYAKFRLLVDLGNLPDGSHYLDFEYSQLLWAYQPDGTRNLEIAPGKNLSFPVEEFGLKRESLGQ